MKKLRFILFGFLMAFMSIRCDAQIIFFKGAPESDTILIGKPFNYTLSLTIPNGYDIHWKQFGDTLSKYIDVVGVGEVKTSQLNNTHIRMEQDIQLTSFETGNVTVPEIEITYTKPKDTIRYSLHTDEVGLFVQSMEIDTTKAHRDIKGIIDQSITTYEVLPWVVIGVIALALAYLIYRLVKKSKNKAPVVTVKKKAKPAIPAIVTARTKLTAMKDNQSWDTADTKGFYTDLTDITREYIDGQFSIDAVEMTTEEIVKAINDLGISKFTKAKLIDTLATADFVKFAKASTSVEQNEQSFKDINSFVEDSYVWFQEEEKKKKEEGVK